MKQKIEPLNDKENEWVRIQLAHASKFVDAFSPQDAGQPLTLGALDRAFAAWISSESTERDLINAIINHVGIAFGQALADGLGLQWVVATDEQGCELAVYGLPQRGDILVYPANFVAKRWERRETHFLERSYQKIADDIHAIAREWQS